jgi:conjugal transfer pilin signal peptidase TrbI
MSRRKSKRQFLVKLVIGMAVAVVAMSYLGTYWRIGLDVQTIRCLPWSVYAIHRTDPTPERGALMAFHARGLAPKIADGTLLVKIIAAVPGDHIAVDAAGIRINGNFWGPLNDRALAYWGKAERSAYRSLTLKAGHYLMLGTEPMSYDGRYWGQVEAQQFVGHAYPIW